MYDRELRTLLQSAEDESKTVDERDESRLKARDSILVKFNKEFNRARKGSFGEKCTIKKILPGQLIYPIYGDTEAFARTYKDEFISFKDNLDLNCYTYLKTHPISYDFIHEENIIIHDDYGKDLALHEKIKISELLLNCTCENIESNKPGQIDDKDILNAMSKIGKFNRIGIISNRKKVHKLFHFIPKIFGEPLLNWSDKIPLDNIIVFDLEMLYIFEKEARINLYPIPRNDIWGATVIKKYLPAIMDINSIKKIIKC